MFIKLILFVFIFSSMSILAKEPIKIWEKEFGYINNVSFNINNEILVLDTTNTTTLYWIDKENGSIISSYSDKVGYTILTFSPDSSLFSISSMRSGYIIFDNVNKKVLYKSSKGGKVFFISNSEYYLISEGIFYKNFDNSNYIQIWKKPVISLSPGKPRPYRIMENSILEVNKKVGYLIGSDDNGYALFYVDIELGRRISSYATIANDPGYFYDFKLMPNRNDFAFSYGKWNDDFTKTTFSIYINNFSDINKSKEKIIGLDLNLIKYKIAHTNYSVLNQNFNFSNYGNYVIVGGDGIYYIDTKERFDFNIPNSQNFNLIEDEEVIYFSIENKLFKYDLKNVLSVERLNSEIFERIGNEFILKKNVENIKVIDLHGNYIEFNQNQKLDISSLNGGMYILQYTYNNEIHNYKFIK